MLPRTLEPEVMDSAEEASDYDAMDNLAVDTRFADDLVAFAPRARRILDVGTGTAKIPILVCAHSPVASFDAIDRAPSMLELARKNVAKAGLVSRIVLEERDAKATGYADGAFDAVVSNSLVHHLASPEPFFRELVRLVRAGGVVFVRDLLRPEDEEDVTELVDRYAAPPVDARAVRQRELFAASLRAALRLEEVRALAEAAFLPASSVQATSDRHWTLAAIVPRGLSSIAAGA